MKVLVTGGAGFIGSHLVDRLVEEGYEVIVVDNLSTGRRENVNPQAWLHVADLKDPDWAVGVSADVVFHFAANPEVRAEPRVHFEENVVATFNVLEWARVSGVKTVVFASSSTVYGDARVMPTPEDYPLEPVSVYGAAKAAGEVMCATYARLYGVRCLALRYANVVGPRLRHGALYDFLMKLRKKPEELEVLGDGTQRKSYLHVEEAVEATLRAWRKFEEVGEPYLALNVGNVDSLTVLDVAGLVAEVMGVAPVIKAGGASSDCRSSYLSVEKISKLAGWRPRLSSADSVRRAVRELLEELESRRGSSL
ncbi:NAD-dependent epimerase/dehydratase family protein [Pyrobaculum neutrophilum]|uniref:NAD-dependent epimerase/dehydratase n=1 Tax=Pyrobaculum neutrophilum (strain DSM 2338 / JCM 9278 / NBRC 100436 / V24Sta) TaxID=444157 RepID=B1YD62_PYRNV|nr:NAD-dependent epimerase/dehydratase family protein [Pyrobaculum neutrophilum]ACB39725.1 NAD-dependent epimerase/dehydratase [Pyrobaculum neutrophilum V24Sta]